MTTRTSRPLWIVALSPFLLGQAAAPRDAESVKARRERTLELYRSEARGYTIFRDSTRRQKVELSPEPIYVWTNPTSNGGQEGAVFVWTCQGRAEVIATIFVQPPTGRRDIIHELHSLSLSTLDVARTGDHSWTPEAPGISLAPIPGAPAPANSPRARLVQMRGLLREFSGQTVDRKQKPWDLRFLPQPFFRYQSTDPEVVDGAIFAFVTSAGTDPEALLVIEARRPSPGADPVWQGGYARFTDQQLWIRHKGNEVFSAAEIEFHTGREDEKHRYRLFTDRKIDPIDEEVAAPKPGRSPGTNKK